MTITKFAVTGLSPVPEMQLTLGERLNVVTGDNSLGKTLLLDSLFWALSGEWVNLPAYPDRTATDAPQIHIDLLNGQPYSGQYQFDLTRYDWPMRTNSSHEATLLLYAQAEGSFALWDPTKQNIPIAPVLKTIPGGQVYLKNVVHLSREQVLDGLSYRDPQDGKEHTICNGLLRDWVSWQYRPDPKLFQQLMKALETLAPPDTPFLGAGTPLRIPTDAREIPTLSFAHGEVPLQLAPSGLRRIVALAYLLVWLWNEHRIVSELTRRTPLKNLVILIDELEAHLHPKWQRAILPALLKVAQTLWGEVEVQFLLVTHSPLVLTSAEPLWDAERDQLFHFNLHETGALAGQVTLAPTPFVVHGDANTWLTSEIFELAEARSQEAENAIQQATRLQLQRNPDLQAVQAVHHQLARLLSPLDAFWPLWRYFAKQHGVAG